MKSAIHSPINALWFLSFRLDAYYREGNNPPYPMHFTFPRLCPGLKTKQLAWNIFVKLTELNLSQESSTQEEVLTNKEAKQQLLEFITLASIWRLFGSFFHFLANGIRASAADNRLWHGDLNPKLSAETLTFKEHRHWSAQRRWRVRDWEPSSHRELQKHKVAHPIAWKSVMFNPTQEQGHLWDFP